jgi:hypothetical protein
METFGFHKWQIYLACALISLCVCNPASAGQSGIYSVISEKPGTGLSRIFSASNSNGPLGQDRNVVANDRMLLLWNEPPSMYTTNYDAFHYQILSYDSSNRQLQTYGSLSGDSVTNTANSMVQPAIEGNMTSIVLAGDMIGNGYAEEASVWETSGNKVLASAMPISKSNLAFEDSTVTGEMVGQMSAAISDYGGSHSQIQPRAERYVRVR